MGTKKNSSFLSPTCQTDVEDFIKNIQTDKAHGLNSILTSIPKTLSKNMKIAKILRLFEKGDKLGCSNYKPKSLLPNLNKIFEKLMCHRLTLFLENNKRLSKFQFGFRNNQFLIQQQKVCLWYLHRPAERI